MKSIYLDTKIPSRTLGLDFGIKKEEAPEGLELGEHIIVENDEILGHAIVTGLFLSGNIMVNLKSRKEHPSKL